MLDLTNLQAITLGALEVTQEDGWFAFHRFTPTQEANYAARGYLSRAQSGACVKLEFYTRGGEVSFAYAITPGNARAYYSIDLLTDRVYRYHISEAANTASGIFAYTVPEAPRPQRVTVYFPATAVTRIRDVRLPADAAPHRRQRKILMLGDSMYQGYNPNHFQNTCTNRLADSLDAWMLNQAVGGECFRADNLEPIAFEPDWILVSYGINDWASGRLKDGADAATYYARLTELYPHKPIFSLLPPDIDYLEKTRKNRDMLYCVDSDGSARTFEDMRQLLQRITAPYPNIKSINCQHFIPQYPECFVEDHVHLTDLGNVLLGDALLQALTAQGLE